MSLSGKSFCLQRKHKSRNPDGAGGFRWEKGEDGIVDGEVGLMNILALLRICQLLPLVMVLISLLLLFIVLW